ncbi:hypothetical protein [Gluconobacter oxydans]|uniref:Uncharacterized protein n=1 Tax=Gluconobacter oxydans NBRC 3293 TaxID=1315969 RepID=A0A829X674_GLUOY|nr:hypothetical protein [Gluconobacter oxydans]GEM18327.1 hypothetical protein NBRC3293_2824 [Gluconobacter oxydans NBRC 3293]
MGRIAFPFLTLDQTAISPEPWMLLEDGLETPIGDAWLPDWDAARDLRLRRLVTTDLDRAADRLSMPIDDGALELVIRIGTGIGNMPRRIIATSKLPLTRMEPTVVIDELVPGRSLSQRLLVDTLVILRQPRDGSLLSPGRAGSKLWSDQLDLRLEGEEPRFPMEAVSFLERFAGRPEAYAPWLLHWTPGNLHRDFGGSVRLYLNSDRADVTDRLLAGDRATTQVILADVMTQIITASLRQNEFERLVMEADPCSIAGRAAHWIGLAFPEQDIAAVRSMIDLRPSTFYAGILAAADIVSLENSA